MSENHEIIEVEAIGDYPTTSKRSEDESESSTILCKLCLDEVSLKNKFSLEQCGCFYCISCMKTYVEVLIKDGVVLSITCPDAECVIQGSLQVNEINSLVDSETFEKYSRLKHEQEVAVDPNRTFCPNPNCSNICPVSSPKQSDVKKKKRKDENNSTQHLPIKVTCNACQHAFCHICKTKWSDNHKCNNLESKSGRLRPGKLRPSRSDAAIKRCPVCNVLIEKDRGCAQMMCKNCSHVFCWYCLKLLDNDFMLRHYDKGPCKNFLGHSRSQVLRHRLGVIGLFTAFSLLLIVASPILILAAPIFLCCKWKDCCERAWRRAQVENNNALFAELGTTPQNSLEVISETVDRGQRSEHGDTTLSIEPNSSNDITVQYTQHDTNQSLDGALTISLPDAEIQDNTSDENTKL